MHFSKTLIRHPELSAAQANKDYVLKEILLAIDKIQKMSTNEGHRNTTSDLYDESASLSAAMDELDVRKQ